MRASRCRKEPPMRRLLHAIAIVAVLPAAGFAQPTDACPECMIGLWIGAFSANFVSVLRI